MVEVEVQDAIISIVIDVKPVGLVDDLSPPISTVIVFRVSSCIRAAFPQTYLDRPKGRRRRRRRRPRLGRSRTMDIDPFVAYFSTP